MNLRYCMKRRKHAGGPQLPLHGSVEEADLSPGVFDTISMKFREEPDLLDVEAGDLEWSYQDGYAVVVLNEDTGEPVAFTRLQFLIAAEHPLGAWLELGSTWVAEPCRRKGINLQMYTLLLPHHVDQNILATTTNTKALENGRHMNFVLVHRRQLPLEVWTASCCCPVEKTHSPDPANHGCVRAYGESQCGSEGVCWFRVTQETAARLRLAQSATAQP